MQLPMKRLLGFTFAVKAAQSLSPCALLQSSSAIKLQPSWSNILCNCCRYATAAGVGIASLGLALSANAASVKLGAAGGALVFDPAEVTIKSGETVTWTNNIGFPHNVVFDEDGIPVSLQACWSVACAVWCAPVYDADQLLDFLGRNILYRH